MENPKEEKLIKVSDVLQIMEEYRWRKLSHKALDEIEEKLDKATIQEVKPSDNKN